MRKLTTVLLTLTATFLFFMSGGCSGDTTSPPDPATFTVEVTEIQAQKATVHVTASQVGVMYYSDVIPKSEYEGVYGSNIKLYTEALLANKEEWGEMTRKEIVAEISTKSVEAGSSAEWFGLTATTNYVAFAVGLDENGSLTTKATVVNFKTKEQGVSDVSFALTLTGITFKEVVVSVVPSDLEVLYYYDVITKKNLEESHNSSLETYIANLIGNKSMWGDKTVEEIVGEISTKGESNYHYTTLTSDAEYIAFAMGLNLKGEVITVVAREDFQTEKQPMTGLWFEATFSNHSFDGADYTIEPSEADKKYYSTVRPAVACDKFSDEELLNVILMEDSFMISFFATEGTVNYENEHVLDTDAGYYLLVFGYDVDGGSATTPLFKFPYRTTASAINPADCRLDVMATEIKSRGAIVTVTPTDEIAMYLWGMMDEQEYLANKDKMEEYIIAYAQENVDNLSNNFYRGTSGSTYNRTLKPATNYYVWRVTMSEFARPSAPIIADLSFRTLDAVDGDATISMAYEKYFNGDKLYDLDPVKYSTSKGYAYVPVTFIYSSNATTWYGNVFDEDLSDPSVTTDEEVMEVLTSGGGIWCPISKPFLCEWDKPVTFLAVAIDANGNHRVYRSVHTFTKDGASPAEEINVVSSGSSKTPSFSSFLKNK